MDNTQSTGRVDLSGYNGRPFEIHENLGVNQQRGFEGSLGHYQEETPLSKLFFSKLNVETLQKAIAYNANKKLEMLKIQTRVGKQSYDSLHIIMRAIFLQEADNHPCELKKQIQELNGKVISFCIKNIITNVKSYEGYIKEITSPPPVNERPINTSNDSNKELEFDIGFQSFN